MAKTSAKATPATRPAEKRAAVRKLSLVIEVNGAERVGYAAGHLDLQLNERQRVALRRLQDELNRKAERLLSGQVVQNANDTVRWLLERLAAEFEKG